MRALWELAGGKRDGRREVLKPGFYEEFRHLFLGLAGKSNIYEGKGLPTYAKLSGRKAALARSREIIQEMRAQSTANAEEIRAAVESGKDRLARLAEQGKGLSPGQ